MAIYLIVLQKNIAIIYFFVDGLVWFSLNFVLNVDIGNINVHKYVALAMFLFESSRGKGPKPYVGPWALFKDTNWFEGKEVNGERPPNQTP